MRREFMTLSYHGDAAVKEKYVSRVKAHYDADDIIQGEYWENGKGCAVGCIVETSDSPHFTMSQELGWPLWLCKLTDKLHEGQTNEQSKEWPVKIVNAVPVGLSKRQFDIVKAKFFHWLFVDETYGVLRHAKTERTASSIKTMAS